MVHEHKRIQKLRKEECSIILNSLEFGGIKIFINTATKAERIIAYRDEHGKFNSIEELKNVKGIGSKIVAVIKAEEGK